MLSASRTPCGSGQTLEELLGALVDVEHAQLEVEHRFASHAEEKMARLDNPGMHRADRHLEDAFALDRAELVALALEWRQHRCHIEILAQRVDLGPVVVQGAPARIGMADELQAKPILDFALLPVHGRYGVRERRELRRFGRDRHAEDQETMSGVEGQRVVEVEHPLDRARVVREHADETRVPLAAEMGAETGHQVHPRVEIDFVEARSDDGTDPAREAPSQVFDHRPEIVGDSGEIHGWPPMMPAAWRSNSSSGDGNHTLNTNSPPNSMLIAGIPSHGRAVTG